MNYISKGRLIIDYKKYFVVLTKITSLGFFPPRTSKMIFPIDSSLKGFTIIGPNTDMMMISRRNSVCNCQKITQISVFITKVGFSV